jgi:hypothetical protein
MRIIMFLDDNLSVFRQNVNSYTFPCRHCDLNLQDFPHGYSLKLSQTGLFWEYT